MDDSIRGCVHNKGPDQTLLCYGGLKFPIEHPVRAVVS